MHPGIQPVIVQTQMAALEAVAKLHRKQPALDLSKIRPAVDKLAGWALDARIQPEVLFLSGRLGYELVQKAIMLGVPIVAAVSAPSSLAIELAERFNLGLAGFVRGARANSAQIQN